MPLAIDLGNVLLVTPIMHPFPQQRRGRVDRFGHRYHRPVGFKLPDGDAVAPNHLPNVIHRRIQDAL